jgi:hypothetical protein
MLSLMLGYVNSVLKDLAAAAASPGHQQRQQLADGSSTASSGACPAVPAASPAVAAAAEVAVCTCLLLKRADILFRSVFPLFARTAAGSSSAAGTPKGAAAAAAAALGAFVEAVEAAVLSNLLEGLAPEVMQVG